MWWPPLSRAKSRSKREVTAGGLGVALGGWAGTQTLTPSLVTDTMDFSGMSLIKLKKQEMETQVGACANPTATPLPRCLVSL